MNEESEMRLKKFLPAKTALAKVIRAIRKRDYMVLTSDEIPEIDQIKLVVPEIAKHAAVIKEMRQF